MTLANAGVLAMNVWYQWNIRKNTIDSQNINTLINDNKIKQQIIDEHERTISEARKQCDILSSDYQSLLTEVQEYRRRDDSIKTV